MNARLILMKQIKLLFIIFILFFSLNSWAERSPAVMDGRCALVIADLSALLELKHDFEQEGLNILRSECNLVTKCKFSASEEDFSILDEFDQTFCRSR